MNDPYSVVVLRLERRWVEEILVAMRDRIMVDKTSNLVRAYAAITRQLMPVTEEK